jgi:ubiquinone/menaquinone biosynthesis C-methylase UbiE
MSSVVEQFQEMVVQEWTDAATVEAWDRWSSQMSIQTVAATQQIVKAAEIGPGLEVLDIACGIGGLALTLGPLIVPGGQVTATDLSAAMIAAAERQAAERAVTNVRFQQADAQSLPFADQTFDRVTCRFGVMYFADEQRALREIHRVLKPGGLAAFVAWGPFEQNPFFMLSLAPIFKRIEVPPPPPGAPEPFRYAAAGSLCEALRSAGFDAAVETAEIVDLPWPGPAEELWRHFYDVAVMFRPIIDGLSPEQRQEVIDETIAGYRRYDRDGSITMPATIVVATGRHPLN